MAIPALSEATTAALKAGNLSIDADGLLRLNSGCYVGKEGVVIKSARHFFPFDTMADNSQFKLQGGLWDQFSSYVGREGYSCAARVDLRAPLPPPSGFKKYAGLMYGITFDQSVLDNCPGSTDLVHHDERWSRGRAPRGTLGLHPRADGMVVVYLESLVSPDGVGPFTTRYVHGEYERASRQFMHFDGAEKDYSQECYELRYAATPTRAPHSDLGYNKVFRIDGAVKFSSWTNLVSAFFYSDGLIKELLEGAGQAP